MTRRLRRVAVGAVVFSAGLSFSASVIAQQPAGQAPAATTTTAPAAAEPPAVPVQAPPTAPPPAPGADAALPPVEVIQQQPKPQSAAKVAKKPAQQATPRPQAAAKAAAPEPAPAPQPAPAATAADSPPEPPLSIDQQRALGEAVRTSPLAGSEIAIGKVPGAVGTVSGERLAEGDAKEPQDILQKEVPGVIIADAAGNDLRVQVEYRGFGAGPLNGFPHGLAVYQNGVRINEVFGDTVNFDLIPKNAIADMTVLSGNPIFGLNAIGGSLSIVMLDGFNYQGGEIEVLGGSFGRKQVGVRAGARSGPFAAFVAGEFIDEEGWRDFSPTEVKRGYFDVGVKGSRVEAHVNLTIADSLAGVVAASPVEILAIDRAGTFTSPQTTDLTMIMPSFNVTAKITDTFTISTVGYFRRFKSRVVDGNVAELEACGEVRDEINDLIAAEGLTNTGGGAATVDLDGDPGDLCSEELERNADGNFELEALQSGGASITPGRLGLADFDGATFGVLDRIRTDSDSFGFTLQGVEKAKLFGHNNHFIIGASYDQGKVSYKTSSELGMIGDRYVVQGTGLVIEEPEDFAPRNVAVDTRYLGLYVLNAFDVNEQLTVTAGGRFNYAKVDLEDLSGNFPDITSKHSFQRFNPTVGATYEIVPGITLYGGYSEANRAPTPAELACADPDNPCPIESFLTDDPPLDQVVSKTFELGLRGKMKSPNGEQRLDWGLGLFHTRNIDDILFVSSTVTGRGFFFNAGETLRRGLEASLKYKYGPLSTYASYSYVKATYETANEFSSPANPAAGPCSSLDVFEDACINVEPGDNIPGIPAHRFKTGFDYYLTSRWRVGADLIHASGQYRYGDEANLLDKLGGYTRVDLSTSYQLTESIQIFAFAKNVFDRKYGLFGTLFENEEAPVVAPYDAVITEFENPRSVVPASPVAIYGGVKIKF